MEADNITKDSKGLSLLRLSKRDLFVLLLCTLGAFFSGCELLFLEPFYGLESSSKGMSNTQIGFVFGMAKGGIVVFSPLFGKYLSRIGPKFLYVSGFFVGGSVNLIFGFLDRCPPGAPYFALSLFCRLIMAMGMAAHNTARLTILTTEFSTKISLVFGLTEAARGVGLMIGPLLGGVLYQFGGFRLPFHVMALTLLLVALLLFLALPPEIEAANRKKTSVLSLLSHPLILLVIVSILASGFAIGFLPPSIIINLEQFHLTTTAVGVVYMMNPAFYGLTHFLTGHVTGHMTTPGLLIIVGSFLCCVALFLMGPSPWFLHFHPQLWLAFLCPAIVGMNFALCTNTGLKTMVQGAKEMGLPDNLETHGLLSGVYFTTANAGAFLGNVVGGLMDDEVGFQTASSITGVVAGSTGLIATIFFLHGWIRGRLRRTKEDGPLTAMRKTRYGSSGPIRVKDTSIELYRASRSAKCRMSIY